MLLAVKHALWKQFAAAIDMLHRAISLFPDDNWYTDKSFFYMAYHCTVFLDYYLTIPPDGFKAVLSYTLTSPEHIPQEAIDDVIPDRIYSKKEMMDYVQACREKCHQVIAGLAEEQLNSPWINKADEMAASSTMHFSVLDILLYNLRHVQHHTAQLNLLLRQKINTTTEYVSEAEDKL